MTKLTQKAQIAMLVEQVALLTEALVAMKTEVQPKAVQETKVASIEGRAKKFTKTQLAKIETLKPVCHRLSKEREKPYGILLMENGKVYCLSLEVRNRYIKEGLRKKAGELIWSVYEDGWRLNQVATGSPIFPGRKSA